MELEVGVQRNTLTEILNRQTVVYNWTPSGFLPVAFYWTFARPRARAGGNVLGVRSDAFRSSAIVIAINSCENIYLQIVTGSLI